MNSYYLCFFGTFFVWQVCMGNDGSLCQVAQTCVTDLSEDDCGNGETLTPNSHIFGCCPSCVANTGGGTTPGGCPSTANCLPDGRYAPVQCKGDVFTGRCFCSDESGNRIFGQMWRSQAQASEMTCACSRRRAELEASGRKDVTLHCTSSGDFEPLQCDEGLCWCAQPKTGQPTVTPVIQDDMELLPCYSKSILGEQYLRKCESTVYAKSAIQREQLEHGTNFLGLQTTLCDYDGSYGPYQITNGIARCTNRNGDILGSWSVVQSEMAGMNCNCARDTNVYFPEKGMVVGETCKSNGNYQPNQIAAGDQYYCVDRDGYPTTDFASSWPPDNCQSYA